jgi:[ribosomal protein S18]-alanine N-acetyltransferase
MIRRMTHADLKQVVAIQEEAFAGTTLGFTQLQLEIELKRERSLLWCAQSNDLPVGVLIAWQVDEDFELLNMAVAMSERGRGVGGALVDTLLEHARQKFVAADARSAARVFLEVRTDNVPALALYKARGFETLRLRKGYYQDGCDALELCHVCHAATNSS